MTWGRLDESENALDLPTDISPLFRKSMILMRSGCPNVLRIFEAAGKDPFHVSLIIYFRRKVDWPGISVLVRVPRARPPGCRIRSTNRHNCGPADTPEAPLKQTMYEMSVLRSGNRL